MNDNNQILDIEIMPDSIDAIFWIRHLSFEDRNETYYILNNIFDGVLEKTYSKIQNEQLNWLQNFYFSGKHFDRPIQLFNINATQYRLKTELENIRSIIKSKINPDDKLEIFIIDETDSFKEEYFQIPNTKFYFFNPTI